MVSWLWPTLTVQKPYQIGRLPGWAAKGSDSNGETLERGADGMLP
jgi:hypothetical protein